MKIKVTTTFLDGRDRFEAGDVRTVPNEDADRFINAGWAEPAEGVTLKVNDVIQRTTTEVVNG